MDEYTKKTRLWLEERFKKTDEKGIYFAHQSIYGFRKGPSDPGDIEKYICTHQIINILSHINFTSLLDVGGAEGYKAYVIKKIFGVNVRSCDLSEEACKRAREIFNIEADSADIHELPYKDREFDIVLCSETLEHVTDIKKAIQELLRVSKTGLIITVPNESGKKIKENIEQEVPHGHINRFDLGSFDFLKKIGDYHITKKTRGSLILKVPIMLIDGRKIGDKQRSKYPGLFIDFFNIFSSLLPKIFGKKTAIALIKLDNFLCKICPYHYYDLFIISKDKNCYNEKANKKITISEIISISVPYYYLNQK